MLSEEQTHTILQILLPTQPAWIGLFGSVARNEETPTSDIDILFVPQKEIGLFTLASLKNELEEQLHRPVDLVTENGLNKFFAAQVLEEMQLIYNSREQG